jgi:hypothetical protein
LPALSNALTGLSSQPFTRANLNPFGGAAGRDVDDVKCATGARTVMLARLETDVGRTRAIALMCNKEAMAD